MAVSRDMFLVFVTAFCSTAHAVTPTLSTRVRQGECSDEQLPSYFALDAQIGAIPGWQVEAEITSSRRISVDYGTNFKVLGEPMAQEQYVLTQCGTPQPADVDVDAVAALPAGYARKHFTIPLQKAVVQSTVQLSFIEALGLEDRIAHIPQYASGPCWQKALGCGAQLESSFGGNATVLAAQMDASDATFMDCSSTSPVDCSNVHARPNAVHFSVTQDALPLHSAEHVKFISAFFNKEIEANRIFASTVQAYSSAAVVASPKPVVAWVSYDTYPEACLVLSQASYKLRIVSDAGGENKDGTAMRTQVGSVMEEALAVPGFPEAGKTFRIKLSSFSGSKEDASSAFFSAMGNVDAVIDETYAVSPQTYTFDSFLATMGLSAASELKFVRDQMVFRVDGTLSAADGLDWYESRVAHPDWAVEGLARVLHGDASKRHKYFRNVAKGEAPQVLTASMCAKALPVCDDGAYPAPIKMITPLTTQTSDAVSSLLGAVIVPVVMVAVTHF